MRSDGEPGPIKGKRHECPRCGRSFLKASHLERHVRTHVQDRPFDCPICGQAFARTDALQRHQRTVHRSVSEQTSGQIAFSLPVAQPGPLPPTMDEVIAPTFPSFGPQDVSGPSTTYLSADESVLPPVDTSTFLSSFQDPTLSGHLDMEDIFSSWLGNVGGSTLANEALSQLFLDTAIDSSSPGKNGMDLTLPSDLGLLSTRNDDKSGGTTVKGSRSGGDSNAGSSELSHRTSLHADTWESGLPAAQDTIRNSNSPSRITSPEQVVGELQIDGETNPTSAESMIPSMRFLDSCLHLYFRDFHPNFPILHRPSFQRDRTSPLLLLSMCSIGCMFFGTPTTESLGLQIYERLHHVIVKTRDSKMATETSRIAMTLSALLGQSFSFLYGQPRQMLTAEAFHGTLCTMARRSGVLSVVNESAVTYQQLHNLDAAALATSWRVWAQRESVKRIALGLAIHASELTAYSGLPRLVPAQVKIGNHFSERLFEAESPDLWREAVAQQDLESDVRPGLFAESAYLAQELVNNHVRRTITDADDISMQPRAFYARMIPIAESYGIVPRSASRNPQVEVLWHYVCLMYLSPIAAAEKLAGRDGPPLTESVSSLRAWMLTPQSRLARVHCARLLALALVMGELAFLIPRSAFHATLILYCCLSTDPPPPGTMSIDVTQECDWRHLAELCEVDGTASPRTPLEEHVALGRGCLHIPGILTGSEPHLDLVTLRSTATRFLKRCTPWGIGDALSKIIAKMSL